MSYFNFLFSFIIASTEKWKGLGGASSILNMVASFFLICALIPAYLDARKFKKTFFLEENFFKFFFFGAGLMGSNAVIFFVKEAVDQKWKEPNLWMFLGFILSNSVSAYINSYSWRMKRRNMKEAEKLGISEQQYWETVIAPNLGNKK